MFQDVAINKLVSKNMKTKLPKTDDPWGLMT